VFEALSEKISGAMGRLQGKPRLTEENIQGALADVRTALIEADVHVKVVRSFLDDVRAKLVGIEVPGGVTPGQFALKVVSEELAALMGGLHQGLALDGRPPAVILLVGLQGAGKTSTAGKLAHWLKAQGKTPYLVPADVYRPAAIEQLTTLAQRLGVGCYPSTALMKPAAISRSGVEEARRAGADAVIVDTAGRLAIDEPLMAELEAIKADTAPREILFVADGMTGQDAVNTAQAFHQRLGLTGHILTKMDGDARGGAALSIRAVTGQPVKFMGVGEKMENLEPFHPDRVAGRILGMGDLLGLIEKTQAAYSERQAAELQRKIVQSEFSLEDFLQQIRTMRGMGSIKDLMGMMPGMNPAMKNADFDEGKLKKIEAVISSMTPRERRNHQIINMSRTNRIAKGSGTRGSDVTRVLKQFSQMRKMMKKVSGNPAQMLKGMFPGM